MKITSKQKGITLVEFTIVASTVLLLIFAILELGVFIFKMQTLNDLTRRAARVATVCQVTATNIYDLASSEGVPDGFTKDNLVIEYLDSNGRKITNPLPTSQGGNHDDIRFVSARVEDYDYGFTGVLNFLGENGVVEMPEFKTVLASESLGVERIDEDGNQSYTTCK